MRELVRVVLLVSVAVLVGCSALPPPAQQPVSAASSSAAASPAPVQQTIPNPEQPAAEAELLQVAEQCRALLKDVAAVDTIEGRMFQTTPEQKQAVLRKIGELGYATADPRMDMCNPERVRAFYAAVQAGEDATVSIYQFEGTLSRLTLLHRQGALYSGTARVRWDGAMQPVPEDTAVMTKLDRLELSPKGHLFFGREEPSTRRMRYVRSVRVEPLGEQNRRLQQLCIDPLVSYASTAVFSTNWDSSDLSTLHLNDVFEFLYQKDHGTAAATVFTEAFLIGNNYPKAVLAAVFEETICRYFPVTGQQLRQLAVYDAERGVYAFDPHMQPDASPDWEVVGSEELAGGRQVLLLEAVSPENWADCVATGRVEVELRPDGGFWYRSNTITLLPVEGVSDMPSFQPYLPRV